MFLGSFKKREKITILRNLNGDLREKSKSLFLKKRRKKISSHCKHCLKS